jgi:putative transposase
VARAITGRQVADFLAALAARCGAPARIVCDNGREFTSRALAAWSQASGVELAFIEPGRPTQNAFIESFNGRFRDACLSQRWFRDLAEAEALIGAWRAHYNTERPHSALGYLPPAQYRIRTGRSALPPEEDDAA